MALATCLTVFSSSSAARAQPAPDERPPSADGESQPGIDDASGPDEGTDGQPAPPASPSPPSDEELAAERAKVLFLQGNELRRAGDHEGALVLYEKSRSLVPRVPNSLNAAYCLDQLGRFDEALERYEELLTTFRNDLTDQDRAEIAPQIAILRQKVGSLDVVVDVRGATLVVDGRLRGTLPRMTAARVLPGERLVQVMAEGYKTYQHPVVIEAGKTARLMVRLEPLVVSGRVRIDEPSLAGADVFIDGAPVGRVPYDGGLEPGPHHYRVEKGDIGSAPRGFVVVKGQKVLLEPEVAALSRPIVITARPSTAELRLGGVAVGSGWRGRLPAGRHEIVAAEVGYLDGRRVVDVTPGAGQDVTLALEVDPDHPRWGSAEIGRFWLDVVGHVAVAPSLGSGIEASCRDGRARCESQGTGLGYDFATRVGFELPFALSVEVAAGYMSLGKNVTRTVQHVFSASGQADAEALYRLEDRLVVAGPHVSAGVGYRHALSELLELRSHLLVGAWFSRSRNDATGTATGGGGTAPVSIENANQATGAVSLLITPAVALGVSLDGIRIGLGAALPIVATKGSALDNGEILVQGSDACGTNPAHVTCAPGSEQTAGERAYGAFAIVQPEVTLGYMF